MDRRNCLVRLAACLAASLWAAAAYADGEYDPDFGSIGRTWIDVTSSASDTGSTMIQLPSGNLFMAGGCGGVSCAAWLTPTGTKASGFGTSGTGTAWFNAFAGWPDDESFGTRNAAALSDGRIVVITQRSGGGGYAAILRADGSGLDPAVGNGTGYIAPAGLLELVRVTAQQQIVIVALTPTQPYAMVATRYDSTLHLDTSFGSGGSVTVDFTDGNFYVRDMTLQRDGKIVVIGEVAASVRNVGIIRLTSGGAPDPAFGLNSDGRFESKLGIQYGASGEAIVEDKKGRLVFAGLATTAAGALGEWYVDRILGGGATDSTFNTGQPQQFTILGSSTSNTPRACCVALQSDNRIVVAGGVDRGDTLNHYFGLARLNDDGSFDGTFGIGGQAYGDMSTQAPNVTTDNVNALVVVGGGIVVGSSTINTSDEERFVAAKARTDLLLAADFE